MEERVLKEGSPIISSFSVKSDSATHLKSTVEMCFAHPKTIFTHFRVDGPKLMLYWGDYGAKQDDATKLPFPLNVDNAYDFIYAWLGSIKMGDRTGDGQAVGFEAEWFDFGENFNVMFHAINIYYSK